MRADHTLNFSGIVIVLLLLGCSGESPTSPAPLQPPLRPQPPLAARMGVVSGNVVDRVSGACLIGAVVEVMDGARAGVSATQSECQSPWDYGTDGYSFRDLPPDAYVRLRASKAGYKSKVISAYATTGAASQTNFELEPATVVAHMGGN